METPRKFIVAGNWKMNGTRSSTQSLLSSLTSASLDPSIEVIIAPSALHLTLVRSLLPPSTTTTPIALAAQNVSDRPNGAFTGEISVAQLKDLGVAWALVGHSERRTVMGEGDGLVGKKVKALLEGGLGAILCCGESLGERERGETVGVVTRQLMAVRDVLGEGKGWEGIVVAYEPIWAIGTGKVATTEQAQDAHAAIRSWLKSTVSEKAANETRILYGGSVTDQNCKELAKQPDIDGFLVGGASLKPAFIDIINVKKV